jgi:hypothetical protein
MYSSCTKVEYATDITLGRIIRLKSYRVQRKKGARGFVIAGAGTVCRLVAFSVTFSYCFCFGRTLANLYLQNQSVDVR